ncbi:TetR/AcrR family transcriptional regulator [Streptomyces sp. AV19]|uniref:TetR/AcrR family transcriptional regulator n=1 Tax=Streptomyces sp. AV19 TaxID=2793068 RepID=UPI0018FE16E1|nr:TetR/AcrR family transcriptional regulator [Streptomyces sp. AV19]MBH1936740.1 TetR/AcrR family transcriptional regulator [Streptomyces sp. AV19]MDG4532799.1 TetR/AcrR family transcriptional regulator [Streptomyces sp. AV19]
MSELPLRERKKLRTRQRISDVATRLFFERGFERVTVAEVAEAAEVSAMTVFNHFPRKEDLFLDRIPEEIALWADAVRERDPGERPVAALHRLALRLIDGNHPLSVVGYTPFWRVVLDSPALRARAREGSEELEAAVASAIAETDAGDASPRLTAALAVAIWKGACAASVARVLDGEPVEEVVREHRELVDRAFRALGDVVPLAR